MIEVSKLQSCIKEGDKISGLVVDIYATTRNEDTAEGKGRTIDHSYHINYRAALIACKGIDVMGSDGEVDKKLALKTDDGRYFLFHNNDKPIVVVDSREEVRAAATLKEEVLKKLSSAEKAALGL